MSTVERHAIATRYVCLLYVQTEKSVYIVIVLFRRITMCGYARVLYVKVRK